MRRDFAKIGSLIALMVSLSVPVFSQATQDAVWTGQAQCQLAVQSQGYVHQEIQKWTLTGGPPTQQGAMQVYPATWSVTGQGGAQRAQGAQVMAAQWASNVPPMNAPIAFFIRGSDNRLIVKLWHSQLAAFGGTNAVKQVGGAQTSTAYTAYEWPFPAIDDVATSTNVSGTGTVQVTGNSMPVPAANGNGAATCKWQFTKGASGSPVSGSASTEVAQNTGSAASTVTKTQIPRQSTVAAIGSNPNPVESSSGITTGNPANQGTTANGLAANMQDTHHLVSSAPVSSVMSNSVLKLPSDPTGFKAAQTGSGQVQLSWNSVSGVSTYLLLGPGTSRAGLKLTATSTTLTNIPEGKQQWMVASFYDPGGLLTKSQDWPTASLNIVNAFGAVCSNGTCACPAGKTECPQAPDLPQICVDLQTNPDYCGTCGNRCIYPMCSDNLNNPLRCDEISWFNNTPNTREGFTQCVSGKCPWPSGAYCTQNSQCASGGCNLSVPVGACQSAVGGACSKDTECLSTLFCDLHSCKYGSSLNGVEIDDRITSSKTFTGQLSSDGEENWAWLRCDTPTCTISIQVYYSDQIHSDVLNSNRQFVLGMIAPPFQTNSQNGIVTYQVKVNGGGITYYYVRVLLSKVNYNYSGQIPIPSNYTLTLSGN